MQFIEKQEKNFCEIHLNKFIISNPEISIESIHGMSHSWEIFSRLKAEKKRTSVKKKCQKRV